MKNNNRKHKEPEYSINDWFQIDLKLFILNIFTSFIFGLAIIYNSYLIIISIVIFVIHQYTVTSIDKKLYNDYIHFRYHRQGVLKGLLVLISIILIGLGIYGTSIVSFHPPIHINELVGLGFFMVISIFVISETVIMRDWFVTDNDYQMTSELSDDE